MGLLLYLGRFGGLLWERPLYTVCWRLWGVCGAVLAVKAADLPDAREWMKHNFFLYAIHFAWVRFINKAAAAAFPGSAVIALAAFIPDARPHDGGQRSDWRRYETVRTQCLLYAVRRKVSRRPAKSSRAACPEEILAISMIL